MKKGDIVVRISYGKDILFIIDKIIKLKNKSAFVILKGVITRIEADAPIEDLEKADSDRIANYLTISERNRRGIT